MGVCREASEGKLPEFHTDEELATDPYKMAQTFIALITSSPGVTVAIITMAHWYDHATNLVQLSHKMAASFLLSNYEGALEDIRLPFKSFAIDVPDGLLELKEGTVRRIVVGEFVVNEKDNAAQGGTLGFSYTFDVGAGNVWNVESTIPFSSVWRTKSRALT